jgi:predicted dienelactone hydrolase
MESIPSYTGYDYFGELLASHGFIVVSVSANGIAANEGDWADAGGDPFDDKFVGAIDFDNIGAVGHSRGGEGVATWAARDQADGEPRPTPRRTTTTPTRRPWRPSA